MKYIYLDQNKWILLARGFYNNNSEIINLVNELKNKIEKKEIGVFLSLSNVFETLKRKDIKSRDKLWEFMLTLSENNTMCSFHKFLTKYEGENLFHRKLGLKEIDLRKCIFRKGISGLFGMKPTLQNAEHIPKDIQEEMLEKVDSFETLKLILTLPDHIEEIKEISKKLEEEAPKLNSVRDKERSNFKDNNLGNRFVKVIYFSGEIFPILAEANKKFNLPPESILKEGATKEEVELFLRELPCTYTYFYLTDRRDRMRERKIHPHDLNDIFSFSTAIPYCDIVFGEKMFLDIAKQAKLNKIYGTKLVCSLEEFKKSIC